jgi:hypothetical protein
MAHPVKSSAKGFLAAIAIAPAQKARGFELWAALALAKLHQSTAQPARSPRPAWQ